MTSYAVLPENEGANATIDALAVPVIPLFADPSSLLSLSHNHQA